MHKLTLKEVVDNHKVLWTWLADETLVRKRKVHKSEFFKEKGINNADIPKNECYCCEYVKQNSVDGSYIYCPLNWGSAACYLRCYSIDGLYKKWQREDDYIRAAELARQIANIPLKSEFVEQYIKECRESRDEKVIPDEYKENMMHKFMEVR